MRLSRLSSRLERRRDTERLWEHYIHGSDDPTGLREEIAESWRRTRDLYGLDPGLAHPRRVLLPDALLDRRDRDEVLQIALPILHDFESQIAGHVIAYLDGDGWLLFLGGDEGVIHRLDEIHFCPGVNWSEESAGTNGPGTALACRKPVEVFASEHFATAWQPWSCAAAPIRAPGDPAPVGIVDITAPWDQQSRQAMSVAKIIVRAVEERIGAIRGLQDEVVRHALKAARGDGDALIAVDARGRVIAMNEASRRRIVNGSSVPPEIREPLREFLCSTSPGAEGETCFTVPEGPVLTATAIRHQGSTVGAILRVASSSRSRSAPGGPGPSLRYDFASILGESEAFRRVVRLGLTAASNHLPVVLYGESGTGKELFAQAIHSASRREGPFVAVNCGSIPASLVEAELLGYEAGTFTGGRRGGNPGRFEDADGGTLFLDELSELPPPAQTALLRVLQEKEVVRLGGSRPRRVDVRVLAATNKPLEEEVSGRRLRHDLYYRLNVLTMSLPPLRDRGEDVCLLARVFLEDAARQLARGDLTFTAEALDALRGYRWPGNVRELKNVILRAAATAPLLRITPQDLLFGPAVDERVAAGPVSGAATGTLREALLESEHTRLLEALDACEWNFVRAARQLGISRTTLYRLVHKYGISRGSTVP